MNGILLQAAEHAGTAGAAGIDFTTVIVSTVGIVTGGGLLKLYNAWVKKRNDDRKNEESDGLAFRENLLDRIDKMNDKMDIMYNRQLDLVKRNAELSIQLKNANKMIGELKEQIKGISEKG